MDNDGDGVSAVEGDCDDDSGSYDGVLPPGCVCGLHSRQAPGWLGLLLLFAGRRRR